MDIQIRPATENDVLAMQTLRKTGWQDNYVNEETGVTKEILENELAKLPPSEKDLEYNINNLAKPENKDRNLVAVVNGEIIGTVFYDHGDIAVFVGRDFRGHGIGSKLLKTLVDSTN